MSPALSDLPVRKVIRVLESIGFLDMTHRRQPCRPTAEAGAVLVVAIDQDAADRVELVLRTPGSAAAPA